MIDRLGSGSTLDSFFVLHLLSLRTSHIQRFPELSFVSLPVFLLIVSLPALLPLL